MWSRTVGALHFRLDAKKGGTGRTWRECWSMSANVEARQGIPDAKLASSFTRILSPRIFRFLMRTSSSLTASSWRSRAWCRMLCWNVLNGFQNTQKISRDSRACSRFFQVLLLTSTIDKGLLIEGFRTNGALNSLNPAPESKFPKPEEPEHDRGTAAQASAKVRVPKAACYACFTFLNMF